MDRRAVLQWMVATGVGAALQRFSVGDLERLGESAHRRLAEAPGGQRLRLTEDEHSLVAAAAECIIPRTDTPGATDARVADFVDVMLADWYPAADAARFRAGLASLDRMSESQHGVAFVAASAARQVTLVQQLDDEVAALRSSDAARAGDHWYATLKYLTVWGFCTSEAGMRDVLRTHPRPNRYDGAAVVR
jgi:Gluconate 2-dehydrogenase subunit 3